MSMQIWKRLVSMMLVGVMMFAMLPPGAFAESEIPEIEQTIEVEQIDVPMAEPITEIVESDLEQIVDVEAIDIPMAEPSQDPEIEPTAEPEVIVDSSMLEDLQAAVDIILVDYFCPNTELSMEEALAAVNAMTEAAIIEAVNVMEADAYAWLCDDIQVIEEACSDLSAEDAETVLDRGVFASVRAAAEARIDAPVAEIPVESVESEALGAVTAMLDALVAKYYVVDEAGNVVITPADAAVAMDADMLALCDSELAAFAEASAALTEEELAALTEAYPAQLAYIAELQAAVTALMPTALDNVLAQMEALKVNYYREFDGELWVLFETLLVVEDVNVLLAVYEETNAAMNAYDQLTEADKAVVYDQYADVISFMTQYAAAIEAKMSTPAVMASGASRFDTSATDGYYNVLEEKDYNIISGVTETEIIMNNSDGSRRQAFRFFTIDPTSSSIELVPGYYQIDKYASDPTNVAYQDDCKVTDMAAYYESNLGYDIIGGMNTALAYDSNAPYSFLMWEGKVLQDKNDSFGLGHEWLNQHTGACQTYLAVKKNGAVELRGANEPFEEDDWNCIGANFGWLVKDGALVTTGVERTSSPASRSMIGIKADGTLILCQTDGRGANNSVGQSNYEMGEMMLALDCQWAFNCDGGGSSTFISQRAGETALTMRSTPSDGAERPTLNAIFIAKAKGLTPGIFDYAEIKSEFDYFAPFTSYTFTAEAIDTTGAAMKMPEGGAWSLSDASFGTIADGAFESSGKLGEVAVQYIVGGETFEYTINVVHPASFTFGADGTVIPYGKSVKLAPSVLYGADDWNVYYQPDTFAWTFSDDAAGTWDKDTLTYTATTDETKTGTTLTVSYNYSTDLLPQEYKIEFGKGSEIPTGWDFENGTVSDWMGFSDAKAWSIANNVNNTLVGSDPLAGQFSPENDAHTFLASAGNGQVKNGKYALGITFDNSASAFGNWTYNVLFNVGETRVFRDVENGLNATTLGFWLYIPEGGAGLAFQSQLNVSRDHTAASCKQDHFMFTTVSGVRKNLNSCTEADIPANRWVYASIDISKYDYLSTMPATDESNSRSPSFLRTYIKPATPEKLTFYIDDITLDYSSAVEDRNAPVISGAAYTTADESVALTDGVVIAGNSVGFTANIAESTGSGEISGLNPASAKIYIDGNEVETEANNKTMATKDNVELADGQHRVTFEIEDNWYNRTQLSYEFIVKGEKVALVELSGHNNSGSTPDTDSIYYVDINTTAAEDVAMLEATIQLNTANTWELDHMIVAPGFEVEYIRLDDTGVATYADSTDIHSVANAVAIALYRTGDCEPGAQTLLSIPVRVWSWNGYNNVTESTEPLPSNKPIVNIDYTVLFGYAENNAGDVIEFGGSKSVATTMTGQTSDQVYHEHTVVALEDKPATCIEAGYTNRTYCGTVGAVFTEHVQCSACAATENAACENCGGDGVVMCASADCATCKVGCASVVDWGTTVPATGHVETYTASKAATCTEDGYVDREFCKACDAVVNEGTIIPAAHPTCTRQDEQIVCTVCSAVITSSGLIEADGDRYYLIAGNIQKGWHEVDGEWYYFRSATKKAAQGVVRHQLGSEIFIDYEFKDGRLLDGVWYELDAGMRYYYGPSYYKQEWADIGDARYYFGEDGIRFEGYRTIKDSRFSHDDDYRMYLFGEDGKFIEASTGNGLLVTDNGTYYLVDGYARYMGLMLIGNDYYYFKYYGPAATGEYYVEKTNGLLPAGTYAFGADGKMIKKNGIEGDYYYVDGVIQMTGLTKVDDDYYYFSTTNGKMSRNVTKMVYRVHENCDLPQGEYTFGEDGKVIFPVLNGIVDDYYYIDGVIQKTGLIKLGDDYYYFSTTDGKMSRNVTKMVYRIHASCDLPQGEYTFGADGKVIFPEHEPLNGIVGDYYYVDDVIQMTGLTKIGDDYYYFSTTNGKMSRNITKMVYRIHVDCDLPQGEYTFGEDGKVIFPEHEPLNGIVGDYYYINDVIQKTGLIKIGDDYYYFSTTNGKMSRNVTKMVYRIHEGCDLPQGEYTFGADGKVIFPEHEPFNGIIGDYYYVDDVIQKTGLIKIGDDYYYFSTTNGKMSRSVTKMVYRIHESCDLPQGEYTFGTDGKVVFPEHEPYNGIVGDYYYINDVIQMTGLTKVGGDVYYFSTTNGKMNRNITRKVYYFADNCKEYPYGGTYTFDADGKLMSYSE